MRKQYRQGDVLFVEVSAVPQGAKVRKNGHILEGEATGHIHRVSEADLDAAEVLEREDGNLFLSVTQRGISIVHEEHDPIQLPVGNYEIIRQREYAPDRLHNVAD